MPKRYSPEEKSRILTRTAEISAAAAAREAEMEEMEEMNLAEVAREETEQKMLYKFLAMIYESESIEDLKAKVKALIKY